MVRLLSGVLLLAALCWTGESRDVCNSSTIAQAESCVKKVMNEKRKKLPGLIALVTPNTRFSKDISVPQYRHIRYENAESIKMTMMDSSIVFPTSGPSMSIICKWEQPLTVTMEIRYKTCMPPGSKTCSIFNAHATTTFTDIIFIKNWKKGDPGTGTVTTEGPHTKLNVTEKAAYNRLVEARRDGMIHAAAAGLRESIKGLEIMLNYWFNKNILPFLSTEMLG